MGMLSLLKTEFSTIPWTVVNEFPDSFIQAISIAPLQVHYYSDALPTQHGYCAGVSHRKRNRQLRVMDLPKVPIVYVAARAGFEPTALLLKGIGSTNAPPCPTNQMERKLYSGVQERVARHAVRPLIKAWT